MYSELNFIWEAWLRIYTNNDHEAVENKVQKKKIDDYRRLMTLCFKEAFHALKLGRWLTVEFSNTKASVWNAIQTSLQESGFVVANVSVLDKKQGSFKAVNTTTAVKQDLVISAYKPDKRQESCLEKAPEVGVWEFVRSHLEYLPRVKGRKMSLNFISERDPRIIYDRLLAYYVQRGYPVPISSSDFQAGLHQKFAERDGMIFLSDQVAEYDRIRIAAAQSPQLDLFVSDERTSIDWLLQFLRKRPSTYQEIHPEFIQQINASWKKYEARPELLELLKRNFLCYNAEGAVPSQIHSYLSSNYKDLRSLNKTDPRLIEKAKGRWYVPDPNKQSDLIKLRERELLEEFEEYKQTRKKLKVFRLEALRVGFKHSFRQKDYQSVIHVARKLPTAVLEEDENLLFFYDNAVTRAGED